MKLFTSIIVFVFSISLMNCRKKQVLPEYNAFKEGKYYYDLIMADGTIYKDFYSLNVSYSEEIPYIGWSKPKEGEVYKIYQLGFKIEYLSIPSDDLINSNVYYGSLGSYEFVYNWSGLYNRASCSATLLSDESFNNYLFFINEPEYPYNELPIINCKGNKIGINRINNRNTNYEINGKNYNTYTLVLDRAHYGFSYNKQFIIDNDFGIVAIENFKGDLPIVLESKLVFSRME